MFGEVNAVNYFEEVKQNVTTRQAAEFYGVTVSRNGMALCPFHEDRHPSMKVDRRFHCFGCHADGDVIDFTARLFNLKPMEAAQKLAADFKIDCISKQEPTIKPHIREPPTEQRSKLEGAHSYKVFCQYLHLLRDWERRYAPQSPEEDFHPLFVEALKKKAPTEYLLDCFLNGSPEERRKLADEQRGEVMKLEQRIAEWSAAGALHRETGQKAPEAQQ